MGWPLPEDIDDVELDRRMYPSPAGRPVNRPVPDMGMIHAELRKKGVTLELLWLEYKREHPDGYQYSQFCERYRQWVKTLDVVLRQTHRAGEKMFVDFAGPTIPVIDPETGVGRDTHVFVAVLGASNYTYAEPCWSEELSPWIEAHCNALEYFKGVPEIVEPEYVSRNIFVGNFPWQGILVYEKSAYSTAEYPKNADTRPPNTRKMRILDRRVPEKCGYSSAESPENP